LEEVARRIVPAHADGCMIEWADRGSNALALSWSDADKQKVARLLTRSSPFMRRAAGASCGELHGVVSDSLLKELADSPEQLRFLRRLRLESCLIVPITARDHQLGTLMIATAGSRRRLVADDLEMARELASRMGLFLDHARLHGEIDAVLRGRVDLLRVVSHDLHNTLAAIGLQAQVMRDQAPAGSQLHRQVDAIEAATLLTRRLVNDLRDLTELESGRLSLRLGTHDVGLLVGSAIVSLGPAAKSKQLVIEPKIDEPLGSLRCDRDRLLQVLLNIIGNAIKFTPAQGHISIVAGRDRGELRVCIQDSGPGIAAADREHVFEKFWRAGAHCGSGIGLFIAKGIVETHGGRIWVADSASGAAVCFTLPTAPPSDRVERAPGPTAALDRGDPRRTWSS
jgi:signal transduction histidine kinase